MVVDANSISDGQRRRLCEMIHHAFVEMRLIGFSGKSQQIIDLADAFHNLPKEMWCQNFDLQVVRADVEKYLLKYPDEHARPYVTMIDEIIAMEE